MRLAGFDDDLPVDGNKFDAGTGLVRLLVSGTVANDGGVEDDEVGEGSFANDAAAREPEPLRRSAAELVDGILQRKETGIPHHRAEQPPRRTKDPRMQARGLGVIDAVAPHQIQAVREERIYELVAPFIQHQQRREAILYEQVIESFFNRCVSSSAA